MMAYQARNSSRKTESGPDFYKRESNCNFERFRRSEEAGRHEKVLIQKEKEEAEAAEAVCAVKAVQEDLKKLYHSKEDEFQKRAGGFIDESVSIYELHQIAVELSMSMDDVLLVKKVFDSFDQDRNGKLDADEFQVAVMQLLKMQLREELTAERLHAMCEWYWWDGDKDKSGYVDFREFLHWYSSNGFNEDLLLTEGERSLRKIAKSYGINVDYVEKIKKSFDLCDTDNSGEVDVDEFKLVLHRCLKVPQNLGVPPSRVQYFWTQIDTDGSGKITFNEFFAWWIKYFSDQSNKGMMPFEAFYKQVRRIGANHLDPPAYPPPKALPDDHMRDSVLGLGSEELLCPFGDSNFRP